MGLDLKLLVVDGMIGGRPAFSHTLLTIEERDHDFFDALREAQREPFPPLAEFNSFEGCNDEDEHAVYGNTLKDAYGEKLSFVTAAQFVECADRFPEFAEGEFNRAAVAYVRALKPKTLIGLYWC